MSDQARRCTSCPYEATHRCAARCGARYCSHECQAAHWAREHEWQCAHLAAELADGAKPLSGRKARKILEDGTVHGHPLTPKQRRFMGWVAGGRQPYSG